MSASSNGTTATITIGTPIPMNMRPVTGAPYSGTLTSQSVQTLPDGTHLTRPSMVQTTTWRDAAGRIRMERPLFPARPGGTPSSGFTVVEVQDPIADYAYMIDSVNRVAHRMQLRAQMSGPPAQAGGQTPLQPHTLPDGSVVTAESLGTKIMFGVTVIGVRDTTVHPAGSRMGNDHPVTTTNENWTSPELGQVVYSSSTGPDGSQSTTTLTGLTTTPPDPALFQIPAGYQVVEETGPFTVKVALTPAAH